MKKSIAFLACAAALVFPLSAQMHLFIQEQKVQVDDASLSAWVLPVPSTLEHAQDEFRDFVKDRVDVRMRKKNDVLYIAEKVSVPRITSMRGDLIAFTFSTSGHNDIAIVFKLGYDISVNSATWPSEMGNLRSFSKEYMSQLYSNYYSDSIAVLEKDLKGLEKEKEGVEKDMRNNASKIDRNTKNLEKEKDEIKVADLKAESDRLKAENKQLEQRIPGLSDEIGKLGMKIKSLKIALVEIQNGIGAL